MRKRTIRFTLKRVIMKQQLVNFFQFCNLRKLFEKLQYLTFSVAAWRPFSFLEVKQLRFKTKNIAVKIFICSILLWKFKFKSFFAGNVFSEDYKENLLKCVYTAERFWSFSQPSSTFYPTVWQKVMNKLNELKILFRPCSWLTMLTTAGKS